MKRTQTYGTGITARTYTVSEEPLTPENSGFDQWNERIKDRGGVFGAVSCDALEWAKAIQSFSKDELPWADSPLAFANSIRKCIEVAQKAVQDGDADLAAHMAFCAGIKLERARMKFAWEDDALRGQKVAGGSRNRAHSTNSQHNELRKQRFARLGELTKEGMAIGNAAQQCEVEGMGNANAILKQWQRFRAKSSDT